MQKVELYFLLSERHQTEIRNCLAHVTLKQTWFQLETRLMKNDLNAQVDTRNRFSVRSSLIMKQVLLRSEKNHLHMIQG